MTRNYKEEGFFLSSRKTIMYPDCNTTDNLFGGRLLELIDESSGMFAACQMKAKRVVTAYFGGLPFKVPVERGKIVSIYCKTKKEGRTSITIDVIATKRNFDTSEEVEVATTSIVFVSVDENGKPQVWNHNAVKNDQLSYEEIKTKITDYIKDEQRVYPSDIADELDLDYELVCRIVRELEIDKIISLA